MSHTAGSDQPSPPAVSVVAWLTSNHRSQWLPVEHVDLSGADFRAEVIDGLTEESLDGHTEAVEGPGWPQPRSYPVRECLLVVLNEEWEDRLYAERDPDGLEARGS
jgi:hypothetical protein